MSDADSNRDLRDRFRELRIRDATHMQAFEQLLARTRRHRTHIAWRAAWMSIAAGLAVVVIWLSTHGSATQQPLQLVEVQWRSPTDFLLESPNDELLRLAWVPASTSDLGRVQFYQPQEKR